MQHQRLPALSFNTCRSRRVGHNAVEYHSRSVTEDITEGLGRAVTAAAVKECNQAADTIEQRLHRLFQRQDKVTVEDLLKATKDPNDLRSNAFNWAVLKLVWKLDSQSQECRELQDFARGIGRYRAFGRHRSLATGADKTAKQD